MDDELLSGLNARARRVVALAEQEARALNHRNIDTEHLLLGLIDEEECIGIKALESAGIAPSAVQQQLRAMVRPDRFVFPAPLGLTARASKALTLSRREAALMGHDRVGTEHLLLGLVKERDGLAAEVLARLGADLRTLRRQVTQLRHGYRGQRPEWSPDPFEFAPTPEVLTLPENPAASQNLDRYGCNLTRMAHQGELTPAPGLSPQISWLQQILAQPDGGNPILVTGPGSGLAAAESLALDCVRPGAPEAIRQIVLYYVDFGAFGTPDGNADILNPDYAGAIDAICAEAQSRPDITLFFDCLPSGLDVVASRPDLAQRLTALLSGRRPRIIGAAQLADYRRHLNRDGPGLRGLQPVLVAEPMVAYTVGLLKMALR